MSIQNCTKDRSSPVFCSFLIWKTGLGLGPCPGGSKDRTRPDFQTLNISTKILGIYTLHASHRGKGFPSVSNVIPLPLPLHTPALYPWGFPYPCHSRVLYSPPHILPESLESRWNLGGIQAPGRNFVGMFSWWEPTQISLGLGMIPTKFPPFPPDSLGSRWIEILPESAQIPGGILVIT